MEEMNKLKIKNDELCCALLLAAIFDDDLREEVLNRLGRIDTGSEVRDQERD